MGMDLNQYIAKLKAFTSQPDEGVFDEIYSTLRPRKRRRFPIFILGIGSVLLAIVCIAIIMDIGPKEKNALTGDDKGIPQETESTNGKNEEVKWMPDTPHTKKQEIRKERYEDRSRLGVETNQMPLDKEKPKGSQPSDKEVNSQAKKEDIRPIEKEVVTQNNEAPAMKSAYRTNHDSSPTEPIVIAVDRLSKLRAQGIKNTSADTTREMDSAIAGKSERRVHRLGVSYHWSQSQYCRGQEAQRRSIRIQYAHPISKKLSLGLAVGHNVLSYQRELNKNEIDEYRHTDKYPALFFLGDQVSSISNELRFQSFFTSISYTLFSRQRWQFSILAEQSFMFRSKQKLSYALLGDRQYLYGQNIQAILLDQTALGAVLDFNIVARMDLQFGAQYGYNLQFIGIEKEKYSGVSTHVALFWRW